MTHLAPAPTRSTKSARGVFLATVEENPDTEDHKFRLVVSFDALGETVKRPARVAVPMAGGERGAYFLPEKGDQVLVVFEHGDPSRPIVIGTAWNEQRKPPETNQSGNNNTKLIRTPKGHRMIFCDEPGKEKVTIVDRTGRNLIEIDSVAQKIAIQSDGDLRIIAKKDAIFHAQSLKFSAQAQVSATAKEVLVHAEQKFNIFSSSPVNVVGQKKINLDQSPACKVTGASTGKVEGVSELHVSESQQADTANQIAAAKAAEQAEQAQKAQAAAAAAAAASSEAAALAAAQAQQPGLPAAASSLVAAEGLSDGLSTGQMLGLAALGAGVGAGIGAAIAFSGSESAAGAAAAATGGAATATGTAAAAGSAEQLSASGVEPASSLPVESFARDGDAAGIGGEVPRPGDASAPRSLDPKAGTARAGDVGKDVRGRASVTATASPSGIDIQTSTSSSVVQEAAVSRATNPSQVPDVAVRTAQEVDEIQRRGDVEAEARSRAPAPPLQPTAPVVEPRSAAATVAPDSVRSAIDAQARVETTTSDVRAAVREPEQVSEAAARARAEEELIDAGVRPMRVKGELNTEEAKYGDPNMLARSRRDHEIAAAEAEARLKVADAHVSETVSVSTQDDADPIPAPAAKLPDPKKPKPKKPKPEPK